MLQYLHIVLLLYELHMTQYEKQTETLLLMDTERRHILYIMVMSQTVFSPISVINQILIIL
jgi:hypothetical protein